MAFSHETLDVYQVSLKYNSWVHSHCGTLGGTDRHAKDQLLRASLSISLNIAEGNGRVTEGDRRRFFEIARSSALECAAIQDVLEIYNAISSEKNHEGKKLLDRIVAMLTRLGGRGYSVREASEILYGETNPDLEEG